MCADKETAPMSKLQRRWLFGFGLTLLLAGVWDLGEAQTRAPDVEYVPTPHNVVAEMLRLANVTKDDVLYDLGSGDGRVVIAAAKRYGARGVGIDIDPVRIRESRENARKAGVAKRVKFLEQDLFETDVREATVVTLYLLPKLNLQLRPKLLHDLKPGTRVVSHDFDMDDWHPDQVVKVPGTTYEHTVYYWVIPADVAGTWRVDLATGQNPSPATLRLQQQFQEVSGAFSLAGNEVPLSKATLTGERIRFSVVRADAVQMDFDGRVNGDAIRGRVEVRGEAAAGRYDWSAQRLSTSAASSPSR
jgi:SAM-dependent methyltransferase